MTPPLVAKFYFATALCRSSELDEIQQILSDHAPSWSVSVTAGPQQEAVALDVTQPHALRSVVCELAARRGKGYEELVQTLGRGRFERASGGTSIRGRSRAFQAFAIVDDYLLGPSGAEFAWGNLLSIRTYRPTIEGSGASEWLERFFDAVCLRTEPVYAYAGTASERDAQNLDTTGDGAAALGTDLSAFLPGLYWLNYLGPAYTALVDGSSIATEEHVAAFGAGLRIRLADDPAEWSSEQYQLLARDIRHRLGDELFFDRRVPAKRTLAPNFADLYGAGRVEADGRVAIIAGPA